MAFLSIAFDNLKNLLIIFFFFFIQQGNIRASVSQEVEDDKNPSQYYEQYHPRDIEDDPI